MWLNALPKKGRGKSRALSQKALLTTHRFGQVGQAEGPPVALVVRGVHAYVCPTGSGYAGVVWAQHQGVDPLEVLEVVDGFGSSLYAPYIHRSFEGRERIILGDCVHK